jgi:hypothetical protein
MADHFMRRFKNLPGLKRDILAMRFKQGAVAARQHTQKAVVGWRYRYRVHDFPRSCGKPAMNASVDTARPDGTPALHIFA